MSDVSTRTILAAMGQLFYSMSLAMGIMVTYGSYMKKDNNLESSVRQIEMFDTGIAFIQANDPIPAMFTFSAATVRAQRRSWTDVHYAAEVFASMKFR
ncbi:MAG: hypothetical protein ACLTT1_18645 [[Clostridium] scindens]